MAITLDPTREPLRSILAFMLIPKYLLTDVLRNEWRFQGVAASDYFAIRDITTLHKITSSLEEARRLAFKPRLCNRKTILTVLSGLTNENQ
jgi:hypothetical protein